MESRLLPRAFFIEGGGLFHGTRMTILGENITIDDGGLMTANGQGYNRYFYYDLRMATFPMNSDPNIFLKCWVLIKSTLIHHRHV